MIEGDMVVGVLVLFATAFISWLIKEYMVLGKEKFGVEKEVVQGGIEVAKEHIEAQSKPIWHGREFLLRPNGVGGSEVEAEVWGEEGECDF